MSIVFFVDTVPFFGDIERSIGAPKTWLVLAYSHAGGPSVVWVKTIVDVKWLALCIDIIFALVAGAFVSAIRSWLPRAGTRVSAIESVAAISCGLAGGSWIGFGPPDPEGSTIVIASILAILGVIMYLFVIKDHSIVGRLVLIALMSGALWWSANLAVIWEPLGDPSASSLFWYGAPVICFAGTFGLFAVIFVGLESYLRKIVVGCRKTLSERDSHVG
jgi:hypothetical protein